MDKFKGLIAGLVGLAVGACAALPAGRHDALPALPDHYPHASKTPTAGPADRWWERVGDPQLARLIDIAQRNNYDVRLAISRVIQARAGLGEAGARAVPGLSLGGDASDARSGLPDSVKKGLPDTRALRLHADFNWELDLMGAAQAAREGAGADLARARWNVEGARLMVSVEVARQYLALRALVRSEAVAERLLQTREATLQLTSKRVAAGTAAQLDFDRARYERDAAGAALPAFFAQRAAAQDALRVLLGEVPGGAGADLAPPDAIAPTGQVSAPAEQAPLSAGGGSLPALRDLPPALLAEPGLTALLGLLAPGTGLLADPGEQPVGQPADLLRRRPDVQAAAYAAQAEQARLRQAHADRYPRFFLSALLGGEHLTLNGVPFSPVRYTSAALAFSTPILDGGRLEAAEAGQGARRDQADLAYQQVVLHAVQEVDSALAALHAERAHCEALLEARQQALSALARVLALQREGEIDRVGVLELERAALGAEAALLEAERSRGLAAVQMYGALGGGWSGTESTENSR